MTGFLFRFITTLVVASSYAYAEPQLSPTARTVKALILSGYVASVYFDGPDGRTSDPTRLTPSILEKYGITTNEFQQAVSELNEKDSVFRNWVNRGRESKQSWFTELDSQVGERLKRKELHSNPAVAVRASLHAFLLSSNRRNQGTISPQEAEDRARAATASKWSQFKPSADAELNIIWSPSADWSDPNTKRDLYRNIERHLDDPDPKRGRDNDERLFDEWRENQHRELEVIRQRNLLAAVRMASEQLGETFYLFDPIQQASERISPEHLAELEFIPQDALGEKPVSFGKNGKQYSLRNQVGDVYSHSISAKENRLDRSERSIALAEIHALEQANQSIADIKSVIDRAKLPEVEGAKQQLNRLVEKTRERVSSQYLFSELAKKGLGEVFEKALWSGSEIRDGYWKSRTSSYVFNPAAKELGHAAKGRAFRKGFSKFIVPFVVATTIGMHAAKFEHDNGTFDPAYQKAQEGASWAYERGRSGVDSVLGTANDWYKSAVGNVMTLLSKRQITEGDLEILQALAKNVPGDQSEWLKSWVEKLTPADLQRLQEQFANKGLEDLKHLEELVNHISEDDIKPFRELFAALSRNVDPDDAAGFADLNKPEVRNAFELAARSLNTQQKETLKNLISKLKSGSVRLLADFLSTATGEDLKQFKATMKDMDQAKHQMVKHFLGSSDPAKLQVFQQNLAEITENALETWKTAFGAEESVRSGTTERSSNRYRANQPKSIGSPITPSVVDPGDFGDHPLFVESFGSVPDAPETFRPGRLYRTDASDLKLKSLRPLVPPDDNANTHAYFSYSLRSEAPFLVENSMVPLVLPEGKQLRSVSLRDQEGRELPESDFDLKQTPRGIPVAVIKNPQVKSVTYQADFLGNPKYTPRFLVILDTEPLLRVIEKLEEAKFYPIAKELRQLRERAVSEDRFLTLDDIENLLRNHSFYTYFPEQQLRSEVPDENEFKFLTGFQDDQFQFCTQCTGASKMLEAVFQSYRKNNLSGIVYSAVPVYARGTNGFFSHEGHAVFAAIEGSTSTINAWDSTSAKLDPRAPTPDSLRDKSKSLMAKALDSLSSESKTTPPNSVERVAGKSAGEPEKKPPSTEVLSAESPSTPPVEAQTRPAVSDPVHRDSDKKMAATVHPELDWKYVAELPHIKAGAETLDVERQLSNTVAYLQRSWRRVPPQGPAYTSAGLGPDPDRSERVLMDRIEPKQAALKALADRVEAIETHPWSASYRRERAQDRSGTLPTTVALRVANAMKAYATSGNLAALEASLKPLYPAGTALRIKSAQDIRPALQKIEDRLRATVKNAQTQILNRQRSKRNLSQLDEGFVGHAIQLVKFAKEQDFVPNVRRILSPQQTDRCAVALASLSHRD
jgi:hypothetical protein